MLRFGCIADDFTGASDAASFLVKGGMSVQLFNGIPSGDTVAAVNTDAVVIALKSRTQETKAAVKDSLEAIKWLKERGARQFYFKYCSTFDSTREGNIGPVADAVMEYLKVPYTILCPALPVNGRVVKEGRLYVNGVPLNESPMKDHPLTPMWESSIAKLIEPQSKYPSVELWGDELGISRDELSEKLLSKLSESSKESGKDSSHFYVIPDYRDDVDAHDIVRLFGDLGFITGGSGILEELASHLSKGETAGKMPESSTPGRGILLAGSCSKATLGQIAYFMEHGGAAKKISPEKLISGEESIEDIWSFVEKNPDRDVLIYSSDTPENVKKTQSLGQERIAGLLEDTEAEIAKRALKAGIKRIIVAGGETSGAVTKKLGFSSYIIGDSVAPGVPVMVPVEDKSVRLVLKSGNFGQPDFFERALKLTAADEELKKKKETAIWIAKSLFDRNRTTGSSANLSFVHEGKVYITQSGSCFGTLKEDEFAVLDPEGNILSENKPSKEWPLHLNIYRKKPEKGAVIHTHGCYAILWSFEEFPDETDVIPPLTPYLKMKLGTVGAVPYEKPGSKELFDAFAERVEKSDGYLLKQHGAVVPGKDLWDAFYCLEELEESAKIAWMLKKSKN